MQCRGWLYNVSALGGPISLVNISVVTQIPVMYMYIIVIYNIQY